MRVSIWQQFSSNHSAHFTVVGQFASIEDTQRAAEKLRAFFKAIDDWYLQPENEIASQERDDGDGAPPSEPEKMVSQQYGISWYENTMDWYPREESVVQLDHFIFLQPNQTWQGGRPLAELIDKLGGKGMVHGDVDSFDGGEYRHIAMQLICDAPDEMTAQGIIDETNAYMSAKKLAMDNWGNPNYETGVILNTPWKNFARSLGGWTTFSGEISRTDRQLTFDHMNFLSRIGDGLPALVDWLRAKGCTNIRYELSEEIESNDD